MNSDTRDMAEQCARDAGAIIKCPVCHSNYIYADDPEADRYAYGRATEAWKAGDRGFRGMEREQVMSVMKSVLKDASIRCPNCDPSDGDLLIPKGQNGPANVTDNAVLVMQIASDSY